VSYRGEEVVLRSAYGLCDAGWHAVAAGVAGGQVRLQADTGAIQEAAFKSNKGAINTDAPLYLGGLPGR